MKYQRTQVYLEPEHHAALVREAAETGISLAELMRRIVDSHVSETAPRYGTKGWDALIGVAGGGEPSDIMADWKGEIGRAFTAANKREVPTRAPKKRGAER